MNGLARVPRTGFAQVGDYLYSQDLCVGVFDGTNYNTGTCDATKLKTNDSRFPVQDMIIRDNADKPNFAYMAGVLGNLTSSTQAQCVMTSANGTACWVWDSSLSQCRGRYFYEAAAFKCTDDCRRTVPVDSQYVTYVRLDTFKPSAAPPALSLRAAVVAAIAVAGLLV